jgi:hypothetical protein
MKQKGRPKLGPYLDNSYEIDWGKFLYVVYRLLHPAVGRKPVSLFNENVLLTVK